MATVTGTIRVRTDSSGTKIVGVRYVSDPGPPIVYDTKWFPAAGTHIVDAMKNHPGVACTVEYDTTGDPPQDVPSMTTVG